MAWLEAPKKGRDYPHQNNDFLKNLTHITKPKLTRKDIKLTRINVLSQSCRKRDLPINAGVKHSAGQRRKTKKKKKEKPLFTISVAQLNGIISLCMLQPAETDYCFHHHLTRTPQYLRHPTHCYGVTVVCLRWRSAQT